MRNHCTNLLVIWLIWATRIVFQYEIVSQSKNWIYHVKIQLIFNKIIHPKNLHLGVYTLHLYTRYTYTLRFFGCFVTLVYTLYRLPPESLPAALAARSVYTQKPEQATTSYVSRSACVFWSYFFLPFSHFHSLFSYSVQHCIRLSKKPHG